MFELFKNIDETTKIRLLKRFEALTRKYEKNQRILSSVKNDNIICLINSGHIQIIRTDANGNETIIEDIYEGDIFGSITANISSQEYEIITKTEVEITIMEFENILEYNDNTPEYNIFIKNTINILYEKIKEFNNRIEILTSKTIRDKLLTYFKIMANNRIVYLPFNYSDLANYLAINRSAMTREIKLLKEEGLIEVKGKRIKLNYYI